MQVAIDAMLFDLDGIDIVLGMTWLNAIGEMWVDWPHQVMRFKFDNQWVELKGAGKEGSHSSALQSLLGKTRLVIDGLFMSTVGHLVEVTDSNRIGAATLDCAQEQEVQRLLEEFVAVFQEPRGLPPKRAHEHVIHLIEGQGPVNV